MKHQEIPIVYPDFVNLQNEADNPNQAHLFMNFQR